MHINYFKVSSYMFLFLAIINLAYAFRYIVYDKILFSRMIEAKKKYIIDMEYSVDFNELDLSKYTEREQTHITVEEFEQIVLSDKFTADFNLEDEAGECQSYMRKYERLQKESDCVFKFYKLVILMYVIAFGFLFGDIILSIRNL